MIDLKSIAVTKLASIGPRFLPFADVATETVPLSRLLRLSLFQVTVGMALVLLIGTLNRVMIVELAVPASLVACMLALPLIFAPFRVLIGFKSDSNVSALGLRRIPFIWKGTLYQFGGFAIMPFALLMLSGYGHAADDPRWIGMLAAGLAFLMVGAGLHMVQTVGLALATDLVKQEDHPKVVGLMYVMLLGGMVVASLVFGALLDPYTPGKLVQVIQGCAVVTALLNLFAMWKQEPRDRLRAQAMKAAPPPDFWKAFNGLVRRPGTLRLLAVIALGTFGFGMADVLLEPYGGQVLNLSVADTTRLTALLAGGTLVGFAIASRRLGAGGAPIWLALAGAAIGIPGFGAIILASHGTGTALFIAGTVATGLGAGLFGHATLTATVRAAPTDHVGLALGAWGAVQATAAGIGVALGGIARDVILATAPEGGIALQTPYNVIFTTEALCLALAILVAIPLLERRRPTSGPLSSAGLDAEPTEAP